jgi:small conductance mechanosensitive channel
MSTEEITQGVADTFSQVFDSGASTLTLYKLLYAAVLLVVCIVVMKILMKGLDRAIAKLKVERSLHTFLKSTIRILLWFITILIVAGSLGIDALR